MTTVSSEPFVTRPTGSRAIDRVNPVAKLAASAVIGITLILSIDWVSAGVALGLELLLLPFAGVGPRRMLRRTLPALVAAPLGALTILLYGRPSGATHLEFLLVRITDGSIELAIATLLRILAIGLPAIVLFITVDPTDLADGLSQILRLPSRFVLGALAGLRLVSLFLQDWKSLELARRARGVGDTGRIRRFVGQAFALLVLSVRRGSTLATAMEARGFGAPVARTWARTSRFGAPEWVLVLIGVGVAAASVIAAIASGTWNPVFTS